MFVYSLLKLLLLVFSYLAYKPLFFFYVNEVVIKHAAKKDFIQIYHAFIYLHYN